MPGKGYVMAVVPVIRHTWTAAIVDSRHRGPDKDSAVGRIADVLARDVLRTLAMARAAANEQAALAAVEEHGVLLVYPITNRAEPNSLWHVLYPRSEMRWAWDQGADTRVVHLWHLRERLASSRAAVYAKWYKGRAVFFSRPVFVAMLAAAQATRRSALASLSRESLELLSLLEDDSPQSSKTLRREAGLTGRHNEALWNRALRELWERLLIVGTGEVEDGAFPSLAIGATRLIFEDLWDEAQAGPSADQQALLSRVLPPEGGFGKHWQRIRQRLLRAAESNGPAEPSHDAGSAGWHG